MIHIAVLGYGNIGSGVVEVLNRNNEHVAAKAGEEIEVKYVLDLRDFPGDPMESRVVHDIHVILNDPEVKIVVETMGGTNPAYEFVKAALLAGKSVTTSNKELVAKHGAELLEIAAQNNLNFLFEASVGGGIPIIRPLNQSVTSDEIYEITGILNGTTNFMLTKMDQEGMTFDAVLKEAQDRGYAERNPEADVEGYDACRKIAILSSLAFGSQVDYGDIYTEGITKISDIDMKYAKKLGMTVKLFGTSKKENGKIFAMVSPVMVMGDHPLSSVHGVMNGILVRGEVIGDLMFYGAGAGKLPTASAVVADIIDEVKHLNRNIMTKWSKEKLTLADHKKSERQFFVRISNGTENSMDEIAKVFGSNNPISLPDYDEFAVITRKMSEEEFYKKAGQITGIISKIRIAE
ncbi:MAG: homoserine dehydrogenase [Lachnospiraceae bacterium]